MYPPSPPPPDARRKLTLFGIKLWQVSTLNIGNLGYNTATPTLSLLNALEVITFYLSNTLVMTTQVKLVSQKKQVHVGHIHTAQGIIQAAILTILDIV